MKNILLAITLLPAFSFAGMLETLTFTGTKGESQQATLSRAVEYCHNVKGGAVAGYTILEVQNIATIRGIGVQYYTTYDVKLECGSH